MKVVKNLKIEKNNSTYNLIGLTDERASGHYIKFNNNLYGSLFYYKDNNKPTLKINDMYLVEPRLKSNEFCILQFSLARGNNSGGTFDMSGYLFRYSDYIVLTKVELYNASKYEWGGELYTNIGNFWFNGGTTNLNYHLKKSNNVSLYVPNSADYWYARFYGYVINPDWLGKDVVQKTEYYHNLNKS